MGLRAAILSRCSPRRTRARVSVGSGATGVAPTVCNCKAVVGLDGATWLKTVVLCTARCDCECGRSSQNVAVITRSWDRSARLGITRLLENQPLWFKFTL